MSSVTPRPQNIKSYSVDELAQLALERFGKDAELIHQEFNSNSHEKIKTRYVAIDEFFPREIALKVYELFPTSGQMRLMDSFREKKLTSKDFDQFDPLLLNVSLCFQEREVINKIEEILGIKNQVADGTFYAGGLSRMEKGHFLNPHIDNSHNQDRSLYRTLNLLYYVTPNWKVENGGNLELWDNRVKEKIEISSLFNRLVLMETNRESFHSVNEVVVEGSRCCVSNYYFSPKENTDYFHVTSFMGRPNQPLKRWVSRMDTTLRSLVRKIKKQGFGSKDLYKG